MLTVGPLPSPGAPSYVEDPPGGPLRLPPVQRATASFTVRHWTVGDGLPQQEITALAQTPDGYLWCGASDGLARYDGYRFKIYRTDEIPALEGFVIDDLRCDRDGRLWIFDTRGHAALLENGCFRRLGVREGFPSEGARPFVTSATGECWLRGNSGEVFLRYRSGGFEQVHIPGLRSVNGGSKERPWRATRLWADAVRPRWALMDGPLLTADDGEKVLDRHLVRIADDGHCEEVRVRGAGDSFFELHAFFRLSDGTPALTSRDGIYALRDGSWHSHHRFDLPLVKTHGSPVFAHEDERGDFWIGTYYGGLVLSTKEGATRQFRLPEESRRPDVHALIGDNSGSIWVATQDGLYQVRRRIMRSWTEADGLPRNRVNAIVEGNNGHIWMAFDESVVSIIDDGNRIGSSHEPPLDYRIHGVEIEWLCTGTGPSIWTGLRRFRKETQLWQHELWRIEDGTFRRVARVPRPISALCETAEGILFVGTQNGLLRWDPDLEQLVEVDFEAASPGNMAVTALETDVEGILTVALGSEGLFRREGHRWHGLAGPAPGNAARLRIQSLCSASDGELWAGCGRFGLALWRNGQWNSPSDLRVAVPRHVTGVIADDVGGLWLASVTGEGLMRYDRKRLSRSLRQGNSTAAPTHFGREDGLPSLMLHAKGSPMLRDQLGRIWVATDLGAVAINPREWQRGRDTALHPPVHIQEIFVNDQSYDSYVSGTVPNQATEPVVVPPGRRRVEIDYAAPELAFPGSIRYRYKLEGYEDDWSEAGEHTSAVYPDLPPGRYTFHVTTVRQQELEKIGARLALSIQPYWWEHPATRLVGGTLLVGVGWIGYLVRLRRIKTRSRLQEDFSRALILSQENERKRLSSELHDGLGHDLLVIQKSLERESRSRESREDAGRLHDLSEKAGLAIRQIRDIAHDLSPPELGRFGLGPALESITHSTAEATGIRIDSEIDVFEPRLRPERELGLFRIAQEALSNMARHSDASEGRVALKNSHDEVVLVVEDDGRGFDTATMGRQEDATGLGLPGIEERTRLLGGTVEYVSRRKKGVRIRVAIPSTHVMS